MIAADVLVIGGGPAGATAARCLAGAGAAVALLERTENATKHRLGETLPPAARPLVAACDMLDELDRSHPRSYANESSWGGEPLSTRDFIGHPNGHGWRLDRAAFDAAMLDRAAAAGARVLRGARFAAGARERALWTVKVDGTHPSLVRARFVIDASGRHALFASRRRARRIAYDTLLAVAGTFESTAADLSSATLVEPTADGWWYSAALPGGRRVAIFHTDRDLLDTNARSAERFRRRLDATTHIRPTLEAAASRLIGPPRILAANSTRLEWAVDDGWAAVGDAAAAFDPLSSQGIMSAIWSGFAVASAWLSGDEDALDDYAAAVDAKYTDYLEDRARHYGSERRWPASPFWRRRQI